MNESPKPTSASQRVDGHVKIFIQGFKFTIQIEKDELLAKLKGK